jgi:hypothetical protein
MNEKSPQTDYYRRQPRQVYEQYYQDTATVLLYNSLVMANPGNSLRQPTRKEGRQTVELIPRDPNWSNLCIVVYHEGEWEKLPHAGELQTSISLGQTMVDRFGALSPTGLEFIERYDIYFHDGRYGIYRYNMLQDYANPNMNEAVYIYDNERLATDQEITRLNDMINSARTRPADF